VVDGFRGLVEFRWDPIKARQNRHKHGVTFAEATSAFRDPLSTTIADPDHSAAEDRFVLIGRTVAGRLVVVVHVDRRDHVRIISARLADKGERQAYEDE
jgi:uncharacterized protein